MTDIQDRAELQNGLSSALETAFAEQDAASNSAEETAERSAAWRKIVLRDLL